MKQSWRKLIPIGFAVLISLSLIGRALALPGDLDPAFGGTGIVITDLANNFDQANAVAVQVDGSIVAAGFTSPGGGNASFLLARYTSTGSPDLSFGGTGYVTTAIGSGDAVINALVLQPDGNLVVAGSSAVGAKTVFALARYISATGALDPSFGTGGIVTTSISTGNDAAYGLALQSDGKLVAGGAANGAFALARYTITGTLDTSFHTTGYVTTQNGQADIGHAVAVQTDGKIVLVGESDQGGVNAFTTLRYTSGGVLDTSFNFTGVATVKIGNIHSFALAVALQPNDGKIVLAGYNNTASDFALARYNLNGTLDSTFGTTGVITTSFGTGVDEAHAVLVQPTGKIVAVGFSRQAATHNDFALARYLPGGTLDTTFGTGGRVLTDLQSSSDDQALAAVVQPDNMIVAAGTSDNGTATSFDLAVARYQSPSQPPTVSNFSKNGLENVTITFTATDFSAHFSSPDSNLLSAIQITSLPVSGTLKLGANAVSLNQEIPIGLVGSLTYVPDPYFFGSDTFNWNGFDGVNYAAADATVTLNVAFVNQPPTFTPGTNVTVLENSVAYTATSWATSISPGPANEASQTLTFTLNTNNLALFAVQPAITLSGTNGTLTFTPAVDQSGTAIVTATLQDSGGTVNGGQDTVTHTFTVTVLLVNHAPSFAKGPDQSVRVGSSLQTMTHWATQVSAGPASEASQIMTFTLTASNPALFSSLPALDTTSGNLTYTPATNQWGTATITATLQDNGGTANGGADTSAPQTFKITIQPYQVFLPLVVR
jgi:uncharacterized delta-60 repeat protein